MIAACRGALWPCKQELPQNSKPVFSTGQVVTYIILAFAVTCIEQIVVLDIGVLVVRFNDVSIHSLYS